MQKIINFKEGKFLIGICENFEDFSVYENGTHQPITVYFIPNITMNEQICSTYTSKKMEIIIQEVKSIISKNKIFYNNLEITISNKFSGYSHFRHHLYHDLLVVSESSLNIYCKLKKSILKETKSLINH
ncbi:hypothetical protein [Flavobacterium dankookense]|uniref:Uncharacterized protein n=1 Tax=Flavobacterium dankookense TaxID=706186 RepID=A0A4R6QF45_9FLAO|nr:hypothetical protein [Flavobacterium dankookense]TDP61151.1 hypothetical protein BC748_0764 [Flavobacterium dankookense]